MVYRIYIRKGNLTKNRTKRKRNVFSGKSRPSSTPIFSALFYTHFSSCVCNIRDTVGHNSIYTIHIYKYTFIGTNECAFSYTYSRSQHFHRDHCRFRIEFYSLFFLFAKARYSEISASFLLRASMHESGIALVLPNINGPIRIHILSFLRHTFV